MSETRKPAPSMSRAQKAIERLHHKIMAMRDATPMRDGSIEAEEKYLEVYKKAYRESQSSTYFAAAERYRLFLQGKPVPGAPLQPTASPAKSGEGSHELTSVTTKMEKLIDRVRILDAALADEIATDFQARQKASTELLTEVETLNGALLKDALDAMARLVVEEAAEANCYYCRAKRVWHPASEFYHVHINGNAISVKCASTAIWLTLTTEKLAQLREAVQKP